MSVITKILYPFFSVVFHKLVNLWRDTGNVVIVNLNYQT